MAKKSVAAAQDHNAQLFERTLSFDGGRKADGGLGAWYPQFLSPQEHQKTVTEANGVVLAGDTAEWAVGCRIGELAAEEYVAELKKVSSNFYDDEIDGDLHTIAKDMLMGVDPSCSRSAGYANGFFGTLYPYLAFAARTIRESDKAATAKKGASK